MTHGLHGHFKETGNRAEVCTETRCPRLAFIMLFRKKGRKNETGRKKVISDTGAFA